MALRTEAVGEDVAHGPTARFQRHDGARRAPGHIDPNRMSGRRQRGVRQRHAERFAHHLRSRRGAQELAAASGRGASAAEVLKRGLQRHLSAGIARADGLHGARILALFGQQCDAAGQQDAGQVAGSGQRHHHGRKPLIAGGHADYAAARGQGADEAPENRGGVVAEWQGIEHAGGSLRAAVAGIGAVSGEGDGAQRLEFLGRGVHEQADFPVTGVITQRDGRAVGRADAAVGAEDQELLAAERSRIPPHAGILGQAEELAGGTAEQHLGSDGQRALRAACAGANVIERRIVGIEDWAGHSV